MRLARSTTQILAWVLLTVAVGAAAEAHQVVLRAQGVVRGGNERPVEGARVRLFLEDDPDGGPAAVATDADGRWLIVVPSPGRWEVSITADGFLDSVGWLQVLEGRGTPRVEVELRSLDEGTPSFLEGNRVTIQRWIERANSLLDQGRTAEARVEYQKAMRELRVEEHPPILQAVARTYFLEQDYDAAVEALADALRITPHDAGLRQLFTVLLQELGRRDDAEQLLEGLAAEGTTDEATDVAPAPSGPAIERPEIEDAPTSGRTGHYRTRFSESHPLSIMELYLDRFGFTAEEIRPWDSAMGRYDLAEESFDIVVPESYTGEEKFGLFVFVSPTPFGGFTKEEIAQALAERRLIWVGPDNVGNGRSSWYRIHLALDAVHNLTQLYEIDPERIYISGYSGGGRVASAMTLVYPEIFSGGFFFYGVDWFEPLPVPYSPGNFWPAKYPAPGKRQLTQLRDDSRMVFLTGSRDFNRAQTKTTYRQAAGDGFKHVTYLEIPDADHYFGIDGEWLEKGLAALDRAD